MWPAWEWIHRPEGQWVATAHSENICLRDNLKCKRIITSQWYQDNWGDRVVLRKDERNTSHQYSTMAGGHRVMYTVGGSPLGDGGDRILVDDPTKITKGQVRRSDLEASVDFVSKGLSTRDRNPKISGWVMIMQRVEVDDPAGWALEKGWHSLIIPMEYDGRKVISTYNQAEDPRTVIGELLLPQRFDRKHVNSVKSDLGAVAAAGQYQQLPVPDGGNIFKDEWWQYYRYEPEFLYKVQHWDTGQKDKESNAYSCCQTWGVTRTGYYLIDVFRKKLQYPDLKRAIIELNNKYLPLEVVIEDKSSGVSLVQDIKRSTNITARAWPVPTGEDKVFRAKLAAPVVEAGRVYLKEDAPWVYDFKTEHSQAPNGKYMDQVDTTSQAMAYFDKKRGTTISGAKTF